MCEKTNMTLLFDYFVILPGLSFISVFIVIGRPTHISKTTRNEL